VLENLVCVSEYVLEPECVLEFESVCTWKRNQYTFWSCISTNNIATGMVRGDHKYAFNPPKILFRPR
jgi:hypothetical protein